MAFDLKAATPDTSFPANGFLFGADSQTATDPSIYSHTAYLNYILGLANAWTAAQTFSAGAVISGSALTISGNQSIAAWTTNGARIKGVAGTLTDTSSSGTVATAYTDVLGGNTIAASSSTTFTNYYTMFLTAPTAGTNVVFTNKWALGLSGGLNVAGGTINGTVVDISQTWGGTGTYTAVKYNVTDSGPAAAASLLLDMQVGGTTKFAVDKAGTVTIGAATYTLLKNIQNGANAVTTTIGGIAEFAAAQGECYVQGLGFGASSGTSFTIDTYLKREAASTLAQRNSTTSQTHNHYDTYTSSTDYHRLAIKTARATLASVSGATVTATAIIPDGAVVLGVTSKVTVSLGTGGGTTGYTIGTGASPSRWGAIVGTTAGTSSDNTNWTVGTIEAFTSATDVIVTASGGNFNGTGTIYLSVQYLIGQCD